MKKSLLWTSVAFLLLSVYAGGSYALDITVDTTWGAGTYTPSGNLNIKNNATLTILPGATVKMGAGSLVYVSDGGVLVATGVTFTWAVDGQEWLNIDFNGPDARSKFENCVFEHAKGRSTELMAMVYFYGGSSPGPTVTGCTFGNGGATRGIAAAGGASPQITNNTISGFSDAAVYLSSTKSATVTGNQFQNNAAGVHINYSDTTTPTITGNTYAGSTEADVRTSGGAQLKAAVVWNEGPGTTYKITDGLSFSSPGSLTISDGIIVKMAADGWIWMNDSSYLHAVGATFTWADGVSEWLNIHFNGPDARSKFENCVFEHAKGRSTESMAMVYFYGGSNPGPTVTGCTFGNGTATRGIAAAGGASPRIINNTISGFSDSGIYITGPASPLVAGNTITGNRIGINLLTTKSGVYRVNRIQGNTEYGIANGTSSSYPVADARNNWWGNSSGPRVTSNPLGTGDAITTKVDYFPFFGSIADTDSDGMWDEWEMGQFGNLTTATATSDTDLDDLLDKDEFLYGTSPKNRDSDGDGVEDGLEIQVGMNPSLAGDYNIDSDNDTYSNLREEISGTDPYNAASIPPVLADGDPLPSGDGDVDGRDLAGFMTEFGRTNCAPCKYDLDTDGDVDLADLFLFGEDFGRTTP